eukprot:SAG25_NODE_186_length_12406_cov_7.083530_11_plen_76_part_00
MAAVQAKSTAEQGSRRRRRRKAAWTTTSAGACSGWRTEVAKVACQRKVQAVEGGVGGLKGGRRDEAAAPAAVPQR